MVITDAKVYIPVVILSTDDNAKLLHQVKSGFKQTIKWNKYESKQQQNSPNQYSDFLIEPSFQGVNIIFVLTFNSNDSRIGDSRNFRPIEKLEYYNAIIDGRNFFDQPIKNGKSTYEKIQIIVTNQEDDYATGCLLNYNYFKNHYKIIVIDLNKK